MRVAEDRNMTPEASNIGIAPQSREGGRLTDYLRLMRLDHCAKHIFIVPGIVLAAVLRPLTVPSLPFSILLGLVAAVSIASANYVINEWLDRDFDRYHPVKSQRASVQRSLRVRIVLLEWAGLATLGLAAAWWQSRTMGVLAAIFVLQGIVYNVRPLRTKDWRYLDVVSESVNNPLRLMIGWAMVDPTTLPPGSVILTYWLGGAFLMTAKRLSELREIVPAYGRAMLARYRPSLAGYGEENLMIACFVYALLAVFCLAVFLLKYRVEYILSVPVIIALFASYMGDGHAAELLGSKP